MGELRKGKLKHLFRAGNLGKSSRSRQGLEDKHWRAQRKGKDIV